MSGVIIIDPEETPEEAAVQEQLYPFPPPPPTMRELVERPDRSTELVLTSVADPVEAIAFMHPEFAEAAAKHGIDLKQAPGRELEQMRKFFGQGTGLYLVTVDFQLARTEAHKLDERAQKKILLALKPAKKKRAKKKAKVARKPVARRKAKRK